MTYCASFYRCLAFARFWKVNNFEDHLLNVSISMTAGRIFTKKIYIFISLSWVFFENRKNSGLTPGQNDDPVTRT